MKFFPLLTILFTTFAHASPVTLDAAMETTPENISRSWKYKGIIVNEPGWDLWGSSPVIDDEGRCHLFIARWPGKIGFNQGWRKQSEIARYTAPGPEGPFTYQETIIKPDPKDEGWAKMGYHNPNIQRLKDGRYALTYIARPSMKGQPGNQRIDMLIADKIEGPWTLASGDASKPLLDTPADAAIWCGTKPWNGVCNPSLLEMPNGKFHLYFKSAHAGKQKVAMGVAIADKVEGPYVFEKNPVTKNKAVIEDGYAFLWNDEVTFVTTDNHGMIENGGGLLWRSKDGIIFEDAPLQAFPRFDTAYLKNADKSKFEVHYNKQVKFERPQILVIKGKPTYLYVPCGVATDGSNGTNVHLMKLGETDEVNNTSTTMWYDKPADGYGLKSPLKSWVVENQKSNSKGNPDQAWEKYGLPIGNGYMGAMLYGGVELERIQLNEASLWMGGPGGKGWEQNLNKQDAHEYMDEMRQALLEKDKKTVDNLAKEYLRGLGPDNREEAEEAFGRYQTFGEMYIKSPHKGATDYRRELDLATGIHKTSYKHKGKKFERSAFCSYPDRSLVLHYTGEEAQDLKLEIASPHEMKGKAEGGTYCFTGKVVNNGLQLDCRIYVEATGGKVTLSDDGIQVTQSTDTTFRLVLNTNYGVKINVWRGEDASVRSLAQLDAVKKYSYEDLKQRHVADHSALHGRVAVDLGVTDPAVATLPTDQRMKRQKKGAIDHDLEELYFQFGRYLLIASSREGSLPANLQGLWCNEMSPAWRSDYHLNINVQMNYWPSGPCNLIECQRPLIDFIEGLREPGAQTAKAYFNARGWTANLTSNIWGFTAPNPGKDRPRYWAYFPLAGAWLTTHAWEQYSFEGDTKYLREKCWPIMAGTADFLVDSLYKLPNGKLSSTPSWSPEHGPVSLGTTTDIAMAREALQGAVETARILGESGPRIDAWKKTLDGLVDYKIGRFGQIQEWYEDIDSEKDKHRHINHLFGLYPGSQISVNKTPKLAKAARVTLDKRGDGATGWSMGWKINFWARMHDGDRAYLLLRNLFKKGTNPNLLDVHPPFQIDGNFGGTAGIAEMLVQSHYTASGGEIELLPALPKEWHTGSFKGLCARGGYTVDLKWKDGKVTEGAIKASKRGLLKVLINGKLTKKELKAGEELSF